MNTLNVTHEDGYAIVQIENGKVNAINRHLSAEIRDTFLALDKDETVKGVLLTGRPHCFSAGLDVADLGYGTRDDAKDFWIHYLGALQAMVRFSKPFVCAMTGYAPAGATIFALCADYRVMGKGAKHKVGLHEFNMSMQIPEMMGDVYAYYLGEKTAWKMVQKAKLFVSDEALELGLVDESVEVEAVEERAKKHLKRMINIYAPVYKKSKEYFRKGLLAIVDQDIDAKAEVIAKQWEDPFVQQSIQFFLASLKK